VIFINPYFLFVVRCSLFAVPYTILYAHALLPDLVCLNLHTLVSSVTSFVICELSVAVGVSLFVVYFPPFVVCLLLVLRFQFLVLSSWFLVLI
jgi:hypothetical protein